MRWAWSSRVIVVPALAILFVPVNAAASAACPGTTVLYVDDDAPLEGDGASWATAFLFIQDALAAARTPGVGAGGGADEIHVAQGLYRPDQDEAGNVTPGDQEATFALISGVAVMGGYAGLGAPDPDARDIELYETILTGDLAGDDEPQFINYDENSFHVVTGTDVGETAVLDGFTITAGNARGTGYGEGGGGMRNEGVPGPTVARCSFVANIAEGHGGAMFNFSSRPMVSDCAFHGNSAERGAGASGENGSATFINCTFSSNSALCGAGMYNERSDPTLYGCHFSGNDASLGGGLYSQVDCAPLFSECVFEANSADYGAGMMNQAHCDPVLTGCTFSGNVAVVAGGGFWNHAGGDLLLSFCTFDSNQAVKGGGLHLAASSIWTSTIVLSGCDFSGNTASAGGGMSNEPGSDILLSDCTFTGNFAIFEGGAILNEQNSPELHSCSFFENEVDLAYGVGGAISNRDDSSPALYNCTFTGNQGAQGGGIANFLNSHPTIRGCTFSANTAEFGGGMNTFVDCRPLILDCTFEQNVAHEYGGAVWNRLSQPVFSGSTFHDNAAERGAGVYSSEVTVSMKECIFTNNVAEIWGGGIYNVDVDAVAVSRCTFERNSAVAQTGGGMFNAGSTQLLVNDCLFIDNRVAVASDSTVQGTVLRGRFQENHPSGGSDGGSAVDGGNLLIADCTFVDNEPNTVRTSHHAPMTLEDCLFQGNYRCVHHQGDYRLTLRHCAFSVAPRIRILGDASALVEYCAFHGPGGGIYHYGRELIIIGCTFRACDTALAIDPTESAVWVANCILDDNQVAVEVQDPFVWIVNTHLTGNQTALSVIDEGVLIGVGCTLFDNDVGAAVSDEGSVLSVTDAIIWQSPLQVVDGESEITYCDVEGGHEGEGNIDADPLFRDPDNGDFRLSPGSPCIDAGDNTALPLDELDLDNDGDIDEPIPIDLDWNPRLIDDPNTEDTGHGEPPIVDMGAYEFQPPECPADFDGDGDVDTADLLFLLGAWGTPNGDLDGDGDTNTSDLLLLLAAWGDCP